MCDGLRMVSRTSFSLTLQAPALKFMACRMMYWQGLYCRMGTGSFFLSWAWLIWVWTACKDWMHGKSTLCPQPVRLCIQTCRGGSRGWCALSLPAGMMYDSEAMGTTRSVMQRVLDPASNTLCSHWSIGPLCNMPTLPTAC